MDVHSRGRSAGSSPVVVISYSLWQRGSVAIPHSERDLTRRDPTESSGLASNDFDRVDSKP
jgi:hypothetical protein